MPRPWEDEQHGLPHVDCRARISQRDDSASSDMTVMGISFHNTFVYGRLAFAEPAESIRLARRALRVEPGDAVAGVTSSGDILLSLIRDRPRSIRGFDTNRTQTALAKLKYTLRQVDSLDQSLGFLGLTQVSWDERTATWNRLEKHLSADASCLDTRGIRNGILNSGMSTKLVRRAFAALRCLAGGERLARLVSPETSSSQRLEILEQIRNGKRYGHCVRPFMHAGGGLLQHFFFPPGLCANSNYPRQALKDLLGAFERVFEVGFHCNPVFSRYLTGKIPEEQIEHLYSPTAWKTIQETATQVEFETRSLEDGFFALQERSTNAFYLSNAPDYFRPEGLRRLARSLAHAAQSGARVYYLSLESQCPFDRCHIDMPFHHSKTDEQILRNADPVGLYPYLGVLLRE